MAEDDIYSKDGKVSLAEDDMYMKDGTVDYKNNPVNKKKTGTWKEMNAVKGCRNINLVLYFKHRLHQHSATTSKNDLNWSRTYYITPLIGAFLADAYLGRYWTIACFSIIYVIVTENTGNLN
ncbi:protein NRT1/ PTR FAMILY 8.1-like [Cornus florida]|uniref:protein NRT1/ PTR FAMILY 8.1-like n=1 Tax=Cornus florida TaxID=4283 RepID=UPI0028986B74|nr:protein NRT1/ PTR FAMILY 8.1-like [Cornus florida]